MFLVIRFRQFNNGKQIVCGYLHGVVGIPRLAVGRGRWSQEFEPPETSLRAHACAKIQVSVVVQDFEPPGASLPPHSGLLGEEGQGRMRGKQGRWQGAGPWRGKGGAGGQGARRSEGAQEARRQGRGGPFPKHTVCPTW